VDLEAMLLMWFSIVDKLPPTNFDAIEQELLCCCAACYSKRSRFTGTSNHDMDYYGVLQSSRISAIFLHSRKSETWPRLHIPLALEMPIETSLDYSNHLAAGKRCTFAFDKYANLWHDQSCTKPSHLTTVTQAKRCNYRQIKSELLDLSSSR
jgi:hypothetical protein